MSLFEKIRNVSGIGPDATRHYEKIISAGGGFIGILLTMWISHHFLGMQGAALIVASMGASAVLLFAVPHGALSQPWALLGGHGISAVIGVACAQNIADPFLAAPLAVALAIGAMYYLRCIHPPGGATAISAVIGGTQVHELSYQYVFTPVMLNALIMLIAALAVNYAFPWRRYPAGLIKKPTVSKIDTLVRTNQLSHADFKYALGEIGSFVDINEEDLSNIYRLACKHAWHLSDQPEQISAGLYYSNGKQGADLSVRKVITLSGEDDGMVVSYRTVAGEGVDTIETASLEDFSLWQQYEVIPKENSWHRIRPFSNPD